MLVALYSIYIENQYLDFKEVLKYTKEILFDDVLNDEAKKHRQFKIILDTKRRGEIIT